MLTAKTYRLAFLELAERTAKSLLAVCLIASSVLAADFNVTTPGDIVNLGISTNIVLTTTQAATNGFAFIPEANTNLATTNWFSLTVRSNRFANGTNEIFCGRPPGTNAFFRIRIE